MSHYLFGLHLDGALPLDSTGLRHSVCGPEGLLSAIESSLGLPPVENNPLGRILAYRDLIKSSLAEDKFYSNSFHCAPLATAKLLLSWRDSLVEAGWNMDLDHGDAPVRLRVLADIEREFRSHAQSEATHAGRIAAILAEVGGGGQPAIDELIVTDPKEIYPRCWITLFDLLKARYDDRRPAHPVAAPSSMLGSLQAALLGQTSKCTTSPDSFRVITAATAEAAADALANQLAHLDPATTVLIAAPSERAMLNRHLQCLDLPLSTAREESAEALLDLPGLLLRCRLSPLDPQAWLEFLLHPASPIPARLRRRLAEKINDLPGRGPHWEEALESCIADAKEDEAAIERIRQAYADWVDVPWIPFDSMDGPALARVFEPLAHWLGQRGGTKKSMATEDAGDWLIARRAVEDLAAIFRAEGALTSIEAGNLLAEWRASSTITTAFPGQIGSVPALASSEQLTSRIDHVFWWNPPASHTRKSPWTSGELDWLARHGIIPPDEAAMALASESAATRAVLLAGKSLTICHITQSAGGPTEQAGILTRLLALGGRSSIRSARDCLATTLTPSRPLPLARRWWKISCPERIPPREVESFSSVSKVIDSPVDWVLERHAKLSMGPIAGFRVCDDALRKGSILHAAAEEVFKASGSPWRTADEATFHAFLAGIFPGILSARASNYLTRGMEAVRSHLLHSARHSLWHLIGILRDAQVTEVIMERKIDPVPFSGGQIGGRIDMVARREDGQTAVIDLKLGGKTKRRDELQNNRHLQLATYGQLMRASESMVPATAYFILSNGGAMLTRNTTFFHGITPVMPRKDTPGSDWEECWREFEEIYQWRRLQLDQGLIEVPVPGTEPDTLPPIERWAAPKDGNPYSIYKNLTGHPSNA